MSIAAQPLEPIAVGTLRVYVRPPRGAAVEITRFRGVPTRLGTWTFSDPFGPGTLDLSLPAVSALERPGAGDLSWLTSATSVDVVYSGALPPGYPGGGWRWEGQVAALTWESVLGLRVECTGAMRQLDQYLAKPEYLARPIPYEVAIARAFAGKPDLRTAQLRVEWPDDWPARYGAPPAGTPVYLVPDGVSPGDRWSGLLTRTTGSFEPLLTSYVQQLLTAMYTESGRWTLDLDPGRVPVLRHRSTTLDPEQADLVVDPVAPGVEVSLALDWSQSLNVAYGQGTSLAGVGYSGMQVSADGLSTTYEPLAAARQVHPVGEANGWYDPTVARREVMLQLQQGLDASEAATVAAAHLARFGDPGVTGTISLSTDPVMAGERLPRLLVRAGMSVRVPHLLGSRDGLTLAVTSVSVDAEGGKTTLTVDSRFRDALTVEEVQLRGRDALSVTRMLIGGKYTPPVPDQLLPWDYAAGSGCIPGGEEFSCARLFAGMPASVGFPWTPWTTSRPPKDPAWRSCYVRLGPADPLDATRNWAAVSDRDGARLGFPVRMAQAGQIRLVQVAAFDAEGNVLAVPFHLSLYYSRGVNPLSMPLLPARYAAGGADALPGIAYKAGQRYPFFPDAWETYRADGTRIGNETPVAVETAGQVAGWGTYYEKAGHWPGSSAEADPATGLLVDTTPFSFDTSNFDSTFDPYSAERNASNPLAGKVYAMIYCDAQADREVFFAGRMFRVEPGVSV